ncbi:MAG: S8 family serine peptidase [Planctomycetota bacterium]
MQSDRGWPVVAACAYAALSLSASVAHAQAQQATPLFSEVRGEREFRGVLVARPLQLKDAAMLGLNQRELDRRTESAVARALALPVQRYIAETDEFLIALPAGETENSLAAKLLATGEFSYVEPDWLVYPAACPNDTGFASQWHHGSTRMRSCSAWDIQTGNPNIVVAICDTGIRLTHVDLQLHRREGYNVTNALWESQGGQIVDINGHGTNCTGSAAGNGNNGIGIAGAGWNLGHRMMRVTESTGGSASLSNLTTAARVAVDAGDKVASVSYSGVNSSTVFSTGTYVRGKGSMLVWAAGNSNVVLSGNRNDDVLVVGATDQNDARASFSNYGPLVDLMAPGVSIYTTSYAGDASYASVSGTSFACPITAGLCGLIWSRNPNLTPSEVENILRSTCADLGTAGLDDTFGYGRIDSYAALLATPDGSGPDTTPPAAPTTLSATVGNQQVALSWGASTEPDLAGYSVFRAAVSGGPYTELTTTLLTSRTYTDTGLANGTAYFYVITASDLSGNESVVSNEVAATPIAPPTAQLLFADGFESGNLTAGGWIASSTSNAFASTAAAATGSWGARVSRNSNIQKSQSTVGFSSIQVKYTRRTAGLETSEFVALEWWNGSAWTALESTRATAFATQTFNLPAGASNLASFAIRVRASANRNDEWGDIDGVEVWGTPN